jgi:hypothetical protein
MILRIGIRIFAYGLLLVVLILGVLVYKASDIAESYLNKLVSQRGGTVVVTDLFYQHGSGLVLEIGEYSEPNVQCLDVVIEVPLLSVLNYTDALAATINIGELELELTVAAESEAEVFELGSVEGMLREYKANLPRQIAKVVEQFEVQLVHSLSIEIESLRLIHQERRHLWQVTSGLVKDSEGNTMLSLDLASETGSLDVKINHDRARESLSIDFAAFATDWDSFSELYLAAALSDSLPAGTNVYIDPLASKHFFESSGYIRWNTANPNQIVAAVLGNLGALEAYAGSSELFTEPISFGMATNGDTVFRSYLNVPFKRFILNGLAIDPGEGILKVDNSSLLARVSMNGDQIELSGKDLLSLIAGNGSLGFSVELDRFSAELLRSAHVGSLPDELTFDGKLVTSGTFFLSDFQPSDFSVTAALSLERLELPGSSLTASDLEIDLQAEAQSLGELFADGTFRAETIGIAGVTINDFEFTLKSPEPGTFSINGLRFSALGGSVRSDLISYNANTREAEPAELFLDGVDLNQIAAVVPQFKGELSGSASGNIKVGLVNDSLSLIDGGLRLDDGNLANLSYSMNGLLTQSLQPNTAAYKQYSMAERAFEDLSLQKFNLDFFPSNDRTKPIRLTLYGESKQDGIIVPIDYTLNVNADDSDGLIHLLQRMQRGDLEFN